MSDISPSSIRTDDSLEAAIAAAGSTAEIHALLQQAAIDQNLVVPDVFDPQVLLPVEGPIPKGFARTVTIGGKKHVIEAATELELEKATGDLYRALFEKPAATEQQTEQARDAQGRFVAEEPTAAEREAQALEVGRQFDLELRWKRGEISSDVYLAESGALDRALAARGIDSEVLREASEQKQSEQYEKSWSDATAEFLQSDAGRNWPGGEANLQTAGRIISENPQLMNNPSVETLAAVFEYMTENDLVQTNPVTEIANAQSPEELRAILQPPQRRARVEEGLSHGMFDRR